MNPNMLRIRALSQELTATTDPDKREAIENEIADLEYEIEQELNHEYDEDDGGYEY